MATAKPSPAPAEGPVPNSGDSIVLETHQGGRTIAVTIPYTLVRELREYLSKPEGEPAGTLRGRLLDDGIVLERSSDAAAGGDVIGVFRAQPGGWATLNEADRKKLKAAGLARGILLVIRTLAQRPWAATLFAVEAEAAREEAPLAEFPWDEYLLRNGWLLDLAPPPAPQPRPALVQKKRKSGKGWFITLALLLVVGGGAAAYRWLPRPAWQPAEPVAETPTAATPQAITLQVVHAGDDLEVSWNRGSDAVRQASAGTLTIRNGAATRVIEMRPDQLREGRVVFRPLPGIDADVRLEVLDGAGKSEAESVQVLGFDTAPALTLPTPATHPPARPTPPAAPVDVPRRSIPQQRADREGAPAAVRRESAPSAAVGEGRSEAVPIRRVAPELTREVIAEMRAANGKVTVSVLVSINAAGKVDDAKVTGSTGEPSPSGPYIRLASLNAARQWRFHPATAGGRSVASQMTLLFSF